MKQNFPHVSLGALPFDPFMPNERSKTKEHEERSKSNFDENNNFENSQNLMKIEENKS